jgi:leucyl aminopeptidase (aminopeptidase T)
VDTRLIEWMGTARVAVESCARVRPGERVTIVTDAGTSEYAGCRELVDAVYAASRYAGAEVVLVEFTSRTRPNEELPDAVAGAMVAADVLFFLPTYGAIHTRATQAAIDGGARVVVLGGATYFGHTDLLQRLVPRSEAEIEEWGRLTDKLAALFRTGGTLHVTTKKGTDLTCEIGKLQVHTMDAKYRGPKSLTHFIPGMAGGGITPGSARGVQVVDAAIMPIFRPLVGEAAVVLRIEDGFIRGVEGGPAAAEWKAMADALGDPNAFLMVEYGFGAHPRARVPAGRTTNDERLYGGFHTGIGSNLVFGGSVQAKWHVDASGTAATASLNGKVFLEDGVYRV